MHDAVRHVPYVLHVPWYAFNVTAWTLVALLPKKWNPAGSPYALGVWTANANRTAVLTNSMTLCCAVQSCWSPRGVQRAFSRHDNFITPSEADTVDSAGCRKSTGWASVAWWQNACTKDQVKRQQEVATENFESHRDENTSSKKRWWHRWERQTASTAKEKVQETQMRWGSGKHQTRAQGRWMQKGNRQDAQSTTIREYLTPNYEKTHGKSIQLTDTSQKETNYTVIEEERKDKRRAERRRDER